MDFDETDDYPHLARTMDLLADAAARSAPALGICLGAQPAAAALGGRAYPGPRRGARLDQGRADRGRPGRPGAGRPPGAGRAVRVAPRHLRPAPGRDRAGRRRRLPGPGVPAGQRGRGPVPPRSTALLAGWWKTTTPPPNYPIGEAVAGGPQRRQRHPPAGGLLPGRRLAGSGPARAQCQHMIIDCAVYQDGKRARAAPRRRLRGRLRRERLRLDRPVRARRGRVRLGPARVQPPRAGRRGRHPRPPAAQARGLRRHLFVVLKTARYVDTDDTVEFGEIMLFIGPQFVVAVRHKPASALGDVRKQIESRPDLLRFGPGRCCTPSSTGSWTTTSRWSASTRTSRRSRPRSSRTRAATRPSASTCSSAR